MWVFVCLVVIIALLYYGISFCAHSNNQFNKLPGPKEKFFVGNAFDIFKNREHLFYYFRYMANKNKDLFQLTLVYNRFIFFTNPKDVEKLLNGTRYNDKGYVYVLLRPWLHDGLLLSSGKKWYQRRKILTPAFHFNILRHFNTVLLDKSEQLAKSLQNEVLNSKTNLYSFLTDFTINSICETAMGTVLDKESSDSSIHYKDAIHELGTHIFYRATRIWLHPEPIFNMTQVGRAHKRTLDVISSFRNSVIKQRRQDGDFNNLIKEAMKNECGEDFLASDKKRLAMLDIMLKAEQEGKIDIDGVNEEVDTFMFEGHDTTATALYFVFMLLANHSYHQDKIVEESAKILGSTDRRPTLSDLSEMKYLEACIKESLRLYPPVHFVVRNSNHTFKIGKNEMQPGTSYGILIYDLHRRSDQFPEPLEFRPERFLKEPTWHPFAYLPFSGGQRNCIGQKFAMMEMKLAISAVLSEYRLLPVTKPQDIVFTSDIILRTRDPIFTKLIKR